MFWHDENSSPVIRQAAAQAGAWRPIIYSEGVMADGTDTIPIHWLFGRSERRRRAIQYWAGEPAKRLLITAVYEGLRTLPIDACSGFGAMMAKSASRRYSLEENGADT